MELVPGDVQLPFEVTYDADNLNVAMSVYDTTSGAPSLVQGPAAMNNVSGTNTYLGKFTPATGKTYLIFKAVYTDDTFDTLSTDYAAGTETIAAQDVGGGGSTTTGCAITGVVIANPTVIGIVENTTIIGIVRC